MEKIKVILTKSELDECTRMGEERNRQAKLMGLKDTFGLAEEDGLRVSIVGCKGEMAIIKFLKIDQKLTINTFKSVPDVGEYEVRAVANRGASLIIRDNDDKKKIYILVEVHFNYCNVVGYFHGHNALKYAKEGHGGRTPAWFIPQSDLLPVSELPKGFP